MIDPVERDLNENLGEREIEHKKREELEEKWANIRENIEEQLQEISEILNPFHKGEYKEKLEAFALMLEEIAEMARELVKEFE